MLILMKILSTEEEDQEETDKMTVQIKTVENSPLDTYVKNDKYRIDFVD